MKSIERSGIENPRLAKHRQKVVEWLRKYFPAEITDSYHGLADAEKHIEKGHGIVVVGSHFSYRDGPGVFVYVAGQSEAMVGKPWLAPVARHILEVTQLANFVFGTQIDIKPVVTESTKKKWRFRKRHHGQGLRDYIEGSIDTLTKGGVVALFPQSTRMSYLEEPTENDLAMKFLMTRTTKAGVNDFGILPVGFGIKGVEDYEKHDGLNKGVSYDVNIGRLWMKSEVLQSVEETGRSLDGWITDQLGLLVPENYRKIPQKDVIFQADKTQ